MLEEPEVVAAIISAMGLIVAAFVTAVTAALIGKKFYNVKKMKKELDVTKSDIKFLLAVEAEHIKMHKDRDGESYKNRLRSNVMSRGILWSGQNVFSRL